jgi:hypothetical protein
MMYGSTIGDFAEALVNRWKLLPDMEGVVISDGPPLTETKLGTLLLIGDDGDPESDATSSFSQEWLDMAQTRRQETGELIGAVIADDGGTDLSVSRERAFTLLSVCEQALRMDSTLGGIVQSAYLSSGSVRLFQNSAGSAVVVPFVIAYRAIV